MILKQIFKKSIKVIFLVIAFFAVLEGLLWIVNRPSQTLFTENTPGLLHINKKFVKHLSVDEFALSQHFKKDKTANTFRLFVVGEKINDKVPHNPNSSFTHILNYKLQHIYTDKNIELISIPFNSASSFEISKVCRQLKNYEPDLVMICAGKDEFYGRKAYPNNVLTGNPKIDNFLINTQTYQGIKEHLLSGRAISSTAINSSVFQKTVENFETNLDNVVLNLQNNNIPVILVNNSSNLLDVAPQKSCFSSPDSSYMKKLFAKGERAFTEGDYDKAYACFSKIKRKERSHAQTLFYLGKLALKNNDLKSAQIFFRQSADNDPDKLRTPSHINNSIFRIASIRNCPLIDAENLFFQTASLGIPGFDMFTDKQNMNLKGNMLLADDCLHKIAKEGYISKAENNKISSQPPLTPFDTIYEQINSRSHSFSFNQITTTFEEKLVTLFAKKKTTWEESMNKLYDYYIENKNYRMAFKIIENLVLENPYNISLNDKASQTAAIIGDSQLVIHYASRVYKMKPGTDIAQRLVISYLKLDMPESALPYLKYAKNNTLDKTDFNLIYTATNQIIDLKKNLKQKPGDLHIRNQIALQYYSIGNDEVAQLYTTTSSKI
jgi:tetratricopeptide (TPR) repeat protein